MKKSLLMILISVFIFSCNEEGIESSKKQKTNVETNLKKDLSLEKNSNNTLYQKGVEAYKLKKWDESINYLDEVLELNENDINAQKYKKLTITEKANKVLLKDADELLVKNDYLLAMLKLKRIKNTSLYYAKAKDGIKKSQKQYKEYRFSAAQKALKNKNYKGSSSYLKSLLTRTLD